MYRRGRFGLGQGFRAGASSSKRIEEFGSDEVLVCDDPMRCDAMLWFSERIWEAQIKLCWVLGLCEDLGRGEECHRVCEFQPFPFPFPPFQPVPSWPFIDDPVSRNSCAIC